MRYTSAAAIALGLAIGLSMSPTCAAQATAVSKSVQDGSSIVKAVVINADDDGVAVKAEDRWIVKHYPAYRKVQQALIVKNGHHYDAIKIQNAEGAQKTVYFNISKAFDSLLKLFGKSN